MAILRDSTIYLCAKEGNRQTSESIQVSMLKRGQMYTSLYPDTIQIQKKLSPAGGQTTG